MQSYLNSFHSIIISFVEKLTTKLGIKGDIANLVNLWSLLIEDQLGASII